MVHLLLQTTAGRAERVRELVHALPTIQSADLVSGAFDLVVTIPEGADAEAMIAYCSALGDVLRVLPCHPSRDRELIATG